MLALFCDVILIVFTHFVTIFLRRESWLLYLHFNILNMLMIFSIIVAFPSRTHLFFEGEKRSHTI